MANKDSIHSGLFRLLLAGTAMATLAACGGGGGSGPSNPGEGNPNFFRTAEFNESEALDRINASEGYARISGDVGGDGVRVAVIDDGVDADHVDLDDRIIADLVSTGQVENDNEGSNSSLGPDGHGTAVASIIAGEKNGIGTHGVAFDARIVSFDVFTQDDDPTNGTDSTRNIASAIRTAGGAEGDDEADIMNLSLVTFSDGTPEREAEILEVGEAMAAAAANGKIMVLASGNDGDADPNFPARFVGSAEVAGFGISVGSVDANNDISTFSNRCGIIQDFCMVAPGEDVDLALIDDDFGQASGTSFASPLVAGSAAVIKAAFPGIGNDDVVDRLLTTATDLGAPGTDAVFGRGLLDLEAALAPVGELSLSLSTSVDGDEVSATSSQLSFDSSLGLSGDAEALLERTIALDDQNFPFLVDLNEHVDRRGRTTGIERFIGTDRSLTTVITTDQASVSLSFEEQPPALSDPHRLDFARSETTLQEQPRDPKISFRTEAGDDVDLFMSLNGGSTTDLGIDRRLVSEDADFFKQQTFLAPYENLAGLQSGGGAAYEVGENTRIGVSAFASADSDAPTQMNMQKVELTHRTFGDVELRLGYGLIQEEGGFVGSSASGAFGQAASTDTQFINLSLLAPITEDVSLFGAYSRGRSSTSTANGSLLNDFSSTASEAFGAGVVVKDLMQDDDGLTLMVGQPLRVTSGSADITVPVGRTEDGRVLKETVRADLSPERREIATEAVYRMSLGDDGHTLSTGAFARFNPDHDPNASPDIGFGFKYQLRF